MTTTRNYKRWAARQSPSLSSTANRIRLLMELVTVQSSRAATWTRSKGQVNFKTIFLLPAESPDWSTEASSGPLMLSPSRVWFQMCSVPPSQTENLLLTKGTGSVRRESVRTAKWHQGWILLIISFLQGCEELTSLLFPGRLQGWQKGKLFFIAIKSNLLSE